MRLIFIFFIFLFFQGKAQDCPNLYVNYFTGIHICNEKNWEISKEKKSIRIKTSNGVYNLQPFTVYPEECAAFYSDSLPIIETVWKRSYEDSLISNPSRKLISKQNVKNKVIISKFFTERDSIIKLNLFSYEGTEVVFILQVEASKEEAKLKEEFLHDLAYSLTTFPPAPVFNKEDSLIVEKVGKQIFESFKNKNISQFSSCLFSTKAIKEEYAPTIRDKELASNLTRPKVLKALKKQFYKRNNKIFKEILNQEEINWSEIKMVSFEYRVGKYEVGAYGIKGAKLNIEYNGQVYSIEIKELTFFSGKCYIVAMGDTLIKK